MSTIVEDFDDYDEDPADLITRYRPWVLQRQRQRLQSWLADDRSTELREGKEEE